MKKKHLILILAISFVFISCGVKLVSVNSADYNVRYGWSQEQVEDYLGRPNYTEYKDGMTIWFYYFNSVGRVNPSASSVCWQFKVYLKDGRVEDTILDRI